MADLRRALADFGERLAAWIRYDLLGRPGEAAPAGPPATPEQRGRQALAERRQILADIGRPLPAACDPPGSMGVAFSGGGIRSATISLGVAQGLAHYGRLLDFDYCSTVSGGGYFGSFLGPLFLPEAARGPDAGIWAARPDDAAVPLSEEERVRRYRVAYPLATQLTAKLGLKGFRLNLAVEEAAGFEGLVDLLPRLRSALGSEGVRPLESVLIGDPLQ